MSFNVPSNRAFVFSFHFIWAWKIDTLCKSVSIWIGDWIWHDDSPSPTIAALTCRFGVRLILPDLVLLFWEIEPSPSALRLPSTLEFSGMEAPSETVGKETPSETYRTVKTGSLSDSLIIAGSSLNLTPTLIDSDVNTCVNDLRITVHACDLSPVNIRCLNSFRTQSSHFHLTTVKY